MTTKAKKTHKKVGRVTQGSGNVFADLGLRNPEQELLKAQLTLQIYTILKNSGLTQVQIAKALGVQQPQVSLLMRNRAGNFSVGRLKQNLTKKISLGLFGSGQFPLLRPIIMSYWTARRRHRPEKQGVLWLRT